MYKQQNNKMPPVDALMEIVKSRELGLRLAAALALSSEEAKLKLMSVTSTESLSEQLYFEGPAELKQILQGLSSNESLFHKAGVTAEKEPFSYQFQCLWSNSQEKSGVNQVYRTNIYKLK